METLLQKLMKYEEDMFIKNRGYDDWIDKTWTQNTW
jgi:hypothetical protein